MIEIVHKSFEQPALVDVMDDSPRLQAFEGVRDEIEHYWQLGWV